MTSHLDSHGTTDVKPEMLSGVRTVHSAPHDKYNICGIAHARTKRNDDIFMQRRLHIYWSGGKGLVHRQSTHCAGHISLCGIFFLKQTFTKDLINIYYHLMLLFSI